MIFIHHMFGIEWTNEEESTRKKSKWLLVAYRITESNPHVFKFSAQIRHLYHKVYTYVWGICICLHRCAFLFCDCMYGLCKCVYVQARFWCLIPSLVTFYLTFETVSLTEPGPCLFEYTCWPTSSRVSLSASPQCWSQRFMSVHLTFAEVLTIGTQVLMLEEHAL